MSRRSGFSLLELLVGLALLGLIGAGLAGALQLGTETYGRAQMLGSGSEHAASRAQMRRLIGQATPLTLLTSFPKEFTGTTNSLRFVTLAPLGFARDAAGLRVTLAEQDRRLTATLEPFDDEGAVLRNYTSELATEVSSVSMSYFDDGTWSNTWSDTSTLPQLVRIDINEGTEPSWPEFTVELLYAD